VNESTCPVCGYDALEFPPRDFSICACCGTEFGYDDRVLTHSDLRAEWIAKGCPWFDIDEPRPVDWNPYEQLVRAGLFGPRSETRNAGTIRFGSDVLHVGPPVRVRFGDVREVQLV
jgi:hypothetical protein